MVRKKNDLGYDVKPDPRAKPQNHSKRVYRKKNKQRRYDLGKKTVFRKMKDPVVVKKECKQRLMQICKAGPASGEHRDKVRVYASRDKKVKKCRSILANKSGMYMACKRVTKKKDKKCRSTSDKVCEKEVKIGLYRRSFKR